MAAAILNEWDKFPEEQKIAFRDAAYQRQISNLRTEARNMEEEAWRRERALSEDLEVLRKISGLDPKNRRMETSSGGLIRGSCGMPQRPTKGWQGHCPRWRTPLRAPREIYARSPSCVESWKQLGASRRGLLVLDVVYRPGDIPESYLSGIAWSVPALEKECWRLGLPKMSHPLVEHDWVSRVGNTVHIAGSSYRPAVKR